MLFLIVNYLDFPVSVFCSHFLINNFIQHWVLGFYKNENLGIFPPKFVSCHLVFRLGNFLIGSNSHSSNHASAEYLGTGSELVKAFAYFCLIKVLL